MSDPMQIREKIKAFAGKKINVVLNDNRVIIGELNSVSGKGIDLVNMRLKKMQFTFEQIAEIYFDTIV